MEAPLQTTLGDPIDVILTVTGEASDEAAVPEQPFAPFEILEKGLVVEPSPDGLKKTFTFELRLLCFETGAHELGPVRVRVTSADGELITLESDTRTIEVHSLLANEPDPQLKPPSEPVSVEQDDYRLLIALGARFDDRVVGDVKKFCPDAKIVHIDVDPSSIDSSAPRISLTPSSRALEMILAVMRWHS